LSQVTWWGDTTELGSTPVGHAVVLLSQKWRTQGGDCGTGAAAAGPRPAVRAMLATPPDEPGPSVPTFSSAVVVARKAFSRAKRVEQAEERRLCQRGQRGLRGA